MNLTLNIILIISIIIIGYLLFINIYNNNNNKETFAGTATVVNTQYNNSPVIESNYDNVDTNYVDEYNKYDYYLNSLVDSTKKKRTKRTKINDKYLDMQFHNNYRDVLTAFNNIAPDQKQIFNMGNIPITISKPNTSEVKNLINEFLKELNYNIKTEVTDNITPNSGWDDLAPLKNVKSGWKKEQEILGIPDVYDDPAKKGKVKLIRIDNIEKQDTEAESKYICKIIIQKKNVKEQMIIKLSFVIPKIVTDERTLFKNANCGSDKYVTDNPNNPPRTDHLGISNVIIEEIFVIGYLSDDGVQNINPCSYKEDDGYNFDRMENNEIVSMTTIQKELRNKYNNRKYEMDQFNQAMDNETKKFHSSLPTPDVY